MVFNTRYIHIIIRMFQNSKGVFVNFLRRRPQSCNFQSIQSYEVYSAPLLHARRTRNLYFLTKFLLNTIDFLYL